MFQCAQPACAIKRTRACTLSRMPMWTNTPLLAHGCCTPQACHVTLQSYTSCQQSRQGHTYVDGYNCAMCGRRKHILGGGVDEASLKFDCTVAGTCMHYRIRLRAPAAPAAVVKLVKQTCAALPKKQKVTVALLPWRRLHVLPTIHHRSRSWQQCQAHAYVIHDPLGRWG